MGELFKITGKQPVEVTHEDGKPVKKGPGRPRKRPRPEGEEEPPKRTPRRLLIPGTLDHAFHMVGGREYAIHMTELAAMPSERRPDGDPELAEFLKLYTDLTPHERQEAGLLERLCLCVGLHPSEYFGRVAAAAYRRNYDVAAFAAAASAPLMVEKSIAYGSKEKGFKDRQMLLQAAQIVDTRGPLVQVNQSADNRQVNIQQGPSFEELTAKVSQLIRGDVEAESRALLGPGEVVEGEFEDVDRDGEVPPVP